MASEQTYPNTSLMGYNSSLSADGADNSSAQELESYAEYWAAAWLNRTTPWIALLVAVLGNGAVIITVRKMKTFTSLVLFVTYLGVTDTLCIIFNFLYTQLTRYKVPLGNGGCKALHFLMNFTTPVANWTVVLMTLERFVAVFFPFKISRVFSLKKSVLALLITAFVLLIHASFALWLYIEVIDDGYIYCGEEPSLQDVSRIITWVDLLLLSLLPCLILIFLNSGIIVKLNKSAKVRREAMNTHLLRGDTANSSRPPVSQQHINLSVMLVTVSVAFVILQLPITIFYLVDRHQARPTEARELAIYYLVREVVHTLNEFNHAFNFFFYFLSGRKFRRKCLEVFGCDKCLKRIRVKAKNASISSRGESGLDTQMSKLSSEVSKEDQVHRNIN
ncbi:probable G-protein coupled receptor B0563.6 [Liolophura sinensis]|uniref:probable G-protein coupled receptor B0563.6 n=1 Tax=Liolophura sinensis TaxID=3198878 RepID=UPI003159720B